MSRFVTLACKAAFICAAIGSVTDALIAYSTFDHAGDMHLSWGFNSIMASGVFLYWAFRTPSTSSDVRSGS